jgi:hypothetical protein
MNTKIADLIQISPSIWPGKDLEAQPGEMNVFAPLGIGITGPFPLRPWDDPFSSSPADYYGYQAQTFHPFIGAPISEACGGVIWFDGVPEKADVEAALRLMDVRAGSQRYAVFAAQAENPQEERYLVQLKIVNRFALRFMFGALTNEEYDSFPSQKLSVGELVWKFIEDQQQAWGMGYSWELAGAMGGDGDWAKETLAFGWMVENAYHGVYRLWSRAWLVTK